MKLIVAFLLAVLLLSPKINVISMQGFNAGIRIDDIIIAFLFVTLGFISLSKLELKIEKRYSLFIFCMLICTFICNSVFGQGTLLFPARFIEYAIFIYIGKYLCNSSDRIFHCSLKAVFIANLIVAILQWRGYVGGFTVYGYADYVGDRVVGLTAGPWELGVLLNFATAYFITLNDENKIKVAYTVAFTFAIFLTGSRMSFLANIIIIAVYMLHGKSISGRLGAMMMVVPVVAIAIFASSGTALAERSANIFSYSNFSHLSDIYKYTVVTYGNPDWTNVSMMDVSGADASWSMRVVKWIYAIKMFLMNPVFWFIGVGSGTFSNALDGGWLRILTECGIIGIYFFVFFISRLKSLSLFMKLSAAAFSINMIMIDIYMSYKVMSVLLLCYGYYSEKLRKIKTGR